MLAHDRREWLQGRYVDDGAVQGAATEIRRIVSEARWDNVLSADAFTDTVEQVVRDRSMVGDLQRAWRLLQGRVSDPELQGRFDSLGDRLALATATDGELSAAIFRYEDDSFLLLVDHGLMLCTWLTAQLAAAVAEPAEERSPVAVEDAVAAVRLAIARPAVGARAGLVPPLLLTARQFSLAAALAAEMDMFLVAHEVAHPLLGHFSEHRHALGALAGSAVTSDHAPAAELAADVLGLTLLLDDIDHGRTNPEHLPLRLAAVRLTLAIIDLYEKTCFALQPTSHPPAAARYALLRQRALEPWFGDDLDALLAPLAAFTDALQAAPTEDYVHAAGRVDRRLGALLDRPLWDGPSWARLAELAGLIVPRPTRCRQALRSWFPSQPGDDDLAAFLAELLAEPATRDLAAAGRQGHVLTRLQLVEHVATLLTARGRPELPVWAVAGLLVPTLRRLSGLLPDDQPPETSVTE